MNFVTFARIHGIEIDQLWSSEKIMRCGTVERPKSLNGAYFWDGRRGWVMDWSGEAKTIWYDDPDAKPWTDEEKRLWASKRASAASNQDRTYQRAADQSEAILRSATLSSHDYMTFKGFPATRGLVLDEKLLVPMRNVITNKLQGYQSIWWDMESRRWEKKMHYGMRAKNAVLFLGERGAPETWIVEGFATGLSVRAALRSVGIPAAVVVAFSASNLVQVSDQIPGRRYVFADNDASGVGAKSAESTGLCWTQADEVGYDANDLHYKHGLFAVVGKMMKLRLAEFA
jgi:putative DNA primase/helicase